MYHVPMKNRFDIIQYYHISFAFLPKNIRASRLSVDEPDRRRLHASVPKVKIHVWLDSNLPSKLPSLSILQVSSAPLTGQPIANEADPSSPSSFTASACRARCARPSSGYATPLPKNSAWALDGCSLKDARLDSSAINFSSANLRDTHHAILTLDSYRN